MGFEVNNPWKVSVFFSLDVSGPVGGVGGKWKVCANYLGWGKGGVFISMYSSWREGISEQRGEFISYSLLCTYIR